MSVMVLFEFTVKDELLENFKNFLSEMLIDTRSYDGFESDEAFYDLEDANTIIVIEKWLSQDKYNKYSEWRAERGDIDKIISMLAQPPVRRFMNVIN